MACQNDGPYWGKYRGTVITNFDPTMSGRLLCAVERFPEMVFNWATPCVPYAWVDQGLFAMPPTGANVWIEFENGDLDYPIWSGCYWGTFEIPVLPELGPLSAALVKTFKTQFCTVELDDTPGIGGITIRLLDPGLPPVTLSLDAKGFTVETGPAILNLNAASGLSVTVGETEMLVNEEVASIEVPAVTVTAEAAVGVEATTVNVTADVNSTGAFLVKGAAQVAGSLLINGPTSAAGFLGVEADCNVAGEVTVEGGVQIAGSLSVEGATSAAGFLGVEGDCNVAGALTVEGDEAVAGVIEGVLVPPF